jgi:hypothetical protein
MRNAISDILSNFAFDSVACYGPGSNFVCVGIDPRSPRGVYVPEGEGMPSIPEDQLLAWCARERIWSAEDCCVESSRILNLLAPREATSGLELVQRRRNCDGTSLLFHTKEMLPRRGAAGIRHRRIVPIVLVADDRQPGEHRQGSSENRKGTPR